MELSDSLLTIVLDPHLLLAVRSAEPPGAFRSCQHARFALPDHLHRDDFLSSEFDQIHEMVADEGITLLPLPAIEMADLLPLRQNLALYQIAAIGVARCHHGLLASNCCVFQHAAGAILGEIKVIGGADLRLLLSCN